MIALTHTMRTHCIGRLLIDLPEGSTSEPDASGARIGDLQVSVTSGVSRQQFDQQLEQRWQAVRAMTTDSFGDPYLRIPQRQGTPKNGVIFAYGFRRLDGPDVDGVARHDIYFESEAYRWQDGTLFKVVQSINKSGNALEQLLPRLQSRQPDQIPSQPGLCLNGAFVQGYYDQSEREELTWGIQLPRRLGLVVREDKVWAPKPSMLAKRRDAVGEMVAFLARQLSEPGVVAGNKEYRAANRTVGDLTGEEYLMGGTQNQDKDHFETTIGGEWAFPGRGEPSPLPSINVDMGTSFETTRRPSTLGGFPDAKDAPSGPTEAEFFEVWDAVITSIRFRPGALTPPPLSKPQDRGPSPISYEQAEADRRALDNFLASPPQAKPRE